MGDMGNYGYTLFRTIPLPLMLTANVSDRATYLMDNTELDTCIYVEKSRPLELFAY